MNGQATNKVKSSGGKRRSPPPLSTTASSDTNSLTMNERMSGNGPSMELTSDEVNFLIFRYLQEAGFVHTAFTFINEGMIPRSNISRSDIPPGALITFLQKGLQYIGIEETIRQDGSDRQTRGDNKGKGSKSNNAINNNPESDVIDFSLLSPNAIKALVRRDPPIQLNVPPEAAAAALRAKLEAESKTKETQTHPRSSYKRNGPLATPQAKPVPQQQQQQQQQLNDNEQNLRWAQNNRTQQQQQPNGRLPMNGEAAAAQALASVSQRGFVNTNNALKDRSFQNSDHEAAEILASNMQLPSSSNQMQENRSNNSSKKSRLDEEDRETNADPAEVLILNKHTSEVFMCAWNPVFTDLLATGSGDASARIWTMGGKTAKSGSGTCKLLQHGNNPNDKKNKDVTTLEWSSNGQLLATGSYDGVARVWRKDGSIVHTLIRHMGPIFSLKWNKSGNHLLSGSYDKTTIVWNVSEGKGEVKQQFHHHTAPALDVDWKDDDTFASCSTDKSVLICKVGLTEPLKRFTGHKDEVNAVKWSPSGTLLASCSDDYTAKVWDLSNNSNQPLHDFKSHEQEIYTVKWSPTGPGSKNPTKPLMLATASFDATVRLWNVDNGSCISVLRKHRESVYSVSFSPSGDYLASGSLAGQLYIWRVRDGKHVRSYKGNGDIFEVAWNVEETRVAACFSSNVVNVIDFPPRIKG